MSTRFVVDIEFYGHLDDNTQEIKHAVETELPALEDNWDSYYHGQHCVVYTSGECALSGEPGDAGRVLAEMMFDANAGPFEIVIKFTCLENLPADSFSYGEAEFAAWGCGADDDEQEQEDQEGTLENLQANISVALVGENFGHLRLGSSLRRTVNMIPGVLDQRFPMLYRDDGDPKVTREYCFLLKDPRGSPPEALVMLYDWKETSRYAPGFPSPADFWSTMTSRELCVGARAEVTNEQIDKVLEWIQVQPRR